MHVFDVLFCGLLEVDRPKAGCVDEAVGLGEELRGHHFVQVAVIGHQLIIISSKRVPHFPRPLFSTPLRPKVNCLSSSSVIFFPSFMPFLLLSSCSISVQYSAAMPIPMSLRNLILSSLDFLLIVMSLSIFRVDSLILNGKLIGSFSFSLERDRDFSELSLLLLDYLKTFPLVAINDELFFGFILCSLTSKVK